MSKQILFVTGNKRKRKQAQDALEPFGIEVVSQDCDVDEIQSRDPKKIAVAKAKAAYEVLQQPLAVNDHFWSIHALNGFPGGYIKDINQWFSAEDYLKLLENKDDRRTTLTEHVIYYDGKNIKDFTVEFHGKFIREKRGIGHVSAEQIVVFDGSDKTIAEHIDLNEHARDVHQSAWTKFGKWYREND